MMAWEVELIVCSAFSFPEHQNQRRSKRHCKTTATDNKIQLICMAEPEFPSFSLTFSDVSTSVSETGAKATNAAVMLWRACVVPIINPTKNHSKISSLRLCIIVSSNCKNNSSKMLLFSRNSAVFYWKCANLIGSLTVFYSPIENGRARVALRPVAFLDFWL